MTLPEALAPLCRTIANLDLSHPEAAEAQLNATHPLSALTAVREALLQAHQEGTLTPKRVSPELAFGRVSKAVEATHQLSIDAVDMSGAGPDHTHPEGEVSLCLAIEGEPTFCGRPPGWVIVPPGSRHVPTVRGGRMVIVYFLPHGAMEWHG